MVSWSNCFSIVVSKNKKIKGKIGQKKTNKNGDLLELADQLCDCFHLLSLSSNLLTPLLHLGQGGHDKVDHGDVDHGEVDHGEVDHDKVDHGDVGHGYVDQRDVDQGYVDHMY